VQVPARREAKPRAIPQKRGYTNLTCGHKVEASEVYLTLLGSKLGAMPWCDRCGDFMMVKKTRKRGKKIDADEPIPF
jgi:hypothetical protein